MEKSLNKTLTCFDLGYKVGDKFLVLSGASTFEENSVVELYHDDKSSSPLFRLVSGKTSFRCCNGDYGAYVDLEYVTPFKSSVPKAKTKTYSFEEAYASVKELNAHFGRLKVVTQEDLKRQLLLIKEELEETINAVNSNDSVESLDGACDLFVTVSGFMAQLEVLGYDVRNAVKAVNENNMTKLIDSKNVEELRLTLNKFKKEGLDVGFDVSPLGNKVVVKNLATGKALKPASFVSVKLDSYIPKGEV